MVYGMNRQPLNATGCSYRKTNQAIGCLTVPYLSIVTHVKIEKLLQFLDNGQNCNVSHASKPHSYERLMRRGSLAEEGIFHLNFGILSYVQKKKKKFCCLSFQNGAMREMKYGGYNRFMKLLDAWLDICPLFVL